MGPFTSFRIGGPADVLVEPADVEDVQRIVAQAKAAKVPVFVVGGTNLLIRDGGIRGIVLSLSKLKAIRQEPGEVLYAEGGVGMPTLIGYAIRRSLAGLEWGAGIPGTVAGCVVMNAGTRLGEMKDSIEGGADGRPERPSPGDPRRRDPVQLPAGPFGRPALWWGCGCSCVPASTRKSTRSSKTICSTGKTRSP
ncbi:MAG: FAD-binding protein [Nitrospiraceae bacterium]